VNVDEMLASISSQQLEEWAIFSQLEPFGGQQEDLRAGIMAAVVANSNPYRAKGSPALKPEDLFPSLRPKGLQVQSLSEMKASAMRFAAMMAQGQQRAKPAANERVRVMNG
jgi:hypothetical protein